MKEILKKWNQGPMIKCFNTWKSCLFIDEDENVHQQAHHSRGDDDREQPNQARLDIENTILKALNEMNTSLQKLTSRIDSMEWQSGASMSPNIYIYMNIYIYIYVYTHTNTHTHTYVYIYIYMYTYIYVFAAFFALVSCCCAGQRKECQGTTR